MHFYAAKTIKFHWYATDCLTQNIYGWHNNDLLALQVNFDSSHEKVKGTTVTLVN